MLAYPNQTLDHLHIQEEAEEALQLQLLPEHRVKDIIAHYPVNLYRPNFFVSLGLGLLTLLIVLAGFGLFGLMTNFNAFSGVAFIYGICCYAGLEYMAIVKKHFGSGVDTILMVAVVACITTAFTGLFSSGTLQEVAAFFCSAVVSLFLAYRFVDRLMALAAVVLFLYLVNGLLTIDKSLNVLLIHSAMIICAGLIAAAGFKTSTLDGLQYHKSMLQIMGYAGLVAVYAYSNFYVVQSHALTTGRVYYNSTLVVPMAWLFWTCTFAVPLVYLVAGLMRKNLILARMGVVLGICSVVTFRFYYALLPLEMVLLVCGCLAITIAILLTRYLRSPRHGFIFKEEEETGLPVGDIEGVVTSEAYGAASAVAEPTGTQFGGGSFGGGGSGGRY